MPKIDRFVEDVNGIVVGEMTRTCAIYSPKPEKMAQKSFPLGGEDSEVVKWAEAFIAAKRAEVGPIETKTLGWDKKWELRFYE